MGIHLNLAFIFDFDGTLVDSEQAIYQCFKSITKQLAPHRIDHSKKILIGPPLKDTASEILGPENQDSLDKFVQLFIKMHDEQVIQHTQPYPNVNQVLKKLHIENIPMAVATNKRSAPTLKLIDHFRWNDYFHYIECSNSDEKIRNKEEMIRKILLDDSFKDAYFVGDTLGDAKAAKNNNLRFIRALYGYGKNEDWNKLNSHKEIEKFTDIIY